MLGLKWGKKNKKQLITPHQLLNMEVDLLSSQVSQVVYQ